MFSLWTWFREQKCDFCLKVASMNVYGLEPGSTECPSLTGPQLWNKTISPNMKSGGNVYHGINNSDLFVLFYKGDDAHETKQADIAIAHSLARGKHVLIIPRKKISSPVRLCEGPETASMTAVNVTEKTHNKSK